MFVLGIDPGLAATGYAVVAERSHRPEVRAVGVIRTDASAPTAGRLAELYRDLEGVIVEHHPEVMAVEQVFVNRNLQTSAGVDRATGVAMLAGARHGLEVHEYTPSGVKNAVAGYGGATKEQVQRVLARRLGVAELEVPADAADALAVALCHLQTAGLRAAIDHHQPQS